jgi:hypothetical protein
MHYFGMRKKFCTKLIPNNTCNDVQTIYFFINGTVYLGPFVEQTRAELNLEYLRRGVPVDNTKELTDTEKDQLAWNDGFRHNHNPLKRENQIEGCFYLMYEWWQKTHTLPFTGQLIKWNKP